MTDTITDFERGLLRFPCDAPGLLRRGSPVWMEWLPVAVEPVALCAPHRDSNGELRVCVSDGGASPLLSLVSLDLTDATGRAHLAWWIHEHHCAWWATASGVCPGSLVAVHNLRIYTIGAHYPDSPDTYSWTERDVPAIATLDPDDPRLLPDGSRLVDALALSMVGRHLLAGGGR